MRQRRPVSPATNEAPSSTTEPTPTATKGSLYCPRWWQVAVVVGALAGGYYRSMPYAHLVQADATVIEVATDASRNRAEGGCVVSYSYQVQYRDAAQQRHVAQHKHSAESVTCSTEEVTRGDATHVYYNPERPSESRQFNSDTLGAALTILGWLGAASLLIQWLLGFFRRPTT